LSTITTTELNNRFWDIDIMGSWMEMGMAALALIAGFIMVYPIIRMIIIKRISKNWNPTCNHFREKNQKIQDSLAEMRIVLDCGRACLLQFHNGGTYLDGASIKKFSLTHESCDVGVSETHKERQDTLMTQYLDLLGILSENDACPRLVNDLKDSSFKRHLENTGSLVFALYPVKSVRDNNTIGMILTEWTDWNKVEHISDEVIIMSIEEGSRKIEPHLHEGHNA